MAKIIKSKTATSRQKTNVDPFRIFETASQFEYAARILGNDTNTAVRAKLSRQASTFRLPAVIPFAVNRAFCLELYFKCLIALQGSKIPWEHKLKKLFQKLNATNKRRLEELYNEAFERIPGLVAL